MRCWDDVVIMQAQHFGFTLRRLSFLSRVSQPLCLVEERLKNSKQKFRMKTANSHYEGHTADSYESAYFYEKGAYMEHLCDLVVEILCLEEPVKKPRLLLDIGGGTGNFTKMLLHECPDLRAIVIDPFLADTKSSEEKLIFVQDSAEVFKNPAANNSWRANGYDLVLLKEVCHHFKDSDRIPIFRGVLKNMKRNTSISGETMPSLLIITRPQREIDYPLWDEAREVWARNQPHVDVFVNELKSAGFTKVHYKIEPYPCVIALDRWQQMIKNRFWSTFSHFTDSQLATACKIIEESEGYRLDAKSNIHFEDRLLFIVASI